MDGRPQIPTAGCGSCSRPHPANVESVTEFLVCPHPANAEGMREILLARRMWTATRGAPCSGLFYTMITRVLLRRKEYSYNAFIRRLQVLSLQLTNTSETWVSGKYKCSILFTNRTPLAVRRPRRFEFRIHPFHPPKRASITRLSQGSAVRNQRNFVTGLPPKPRIKLR